MMSNHELGGGRCVSHLSGIHAKDVCTADHIRQTPRNDLYGTGGWIPATPSPPSKAQILDLAHVSRNLICATSWFSTEPHLQASTSGSSTDKRIRWVSRPSD